MAVQFICVNFLAQLRQIGRDWNAARQGPPTTIQHVLGWSMHCIALHVFMDYWLLNALEILAQDTDTDALCNPSADIRTAFAQLEQIVIISLCSAGLSQGFRMARCVHFAFPADVCERFFIESVCLCGLLHS